ncbi:MAG: DNA recombination protein RmuC [Terriglobales bacterium]
MSFQVSGRLDALDQALSQKFLSATADMASRLEQTKGDLRQQMSDRIADGFNEIRTTVDQQLATGRQEQSTRLIEFSGQLEQKFDLLSTRQAENLTAGRQELANSLALTTSQLKAELDAFNQRTAQSLDAMRAQVEEKLLAVSGNVQQKLDENIREGFAHFTKVQEHLKAAEEQLRQVGTLGASINDLNCLLKLPHLRGKFGEASLERLLADFLPSHMYSLQTSPGTGPEHADALINFPDRTLPVDAKFPREQVLPLFESSDEATLADARKQLARVLKTEAKRISQYVQPEQGTMDIALMYLPSETLYFEAITNAEAMEALTRMKVHPVSPNTLLMTLQMVALAYKWYEVAARFEETRKELAQAQTSLGHFQRKFDEVGKGLEKAQVAYDTAVRHLKQYRTRVTAISGEPVPGTEEQLALTAGNNGE